VLPHGGRILGLFAPGDDENFFWTHPALGDAATARDFYEGQQWHNSGGERTWLAPEIDFFFPEFPNLKTYWQQRELDPGRYDISGKDGQFSWSNLATLTLSRTRQKVDLEIKKWLTPAFNPLRYERHLADAGVKYADTPCTPRSSCEVQFRLRKWDSGILLNYPMVGTCWYQHFFAASPSLHGHYRARRSHHRR